MAPSVSHTLWWDCTLCTKLCHMHYCPMRYIQCTDKWIHTSGSVDVSTVPATYTSPHRYTLTVCDKFLEWQHCRRCFFHYTTFQGSRTSNYEYYREIGSTPRKFFRTVLAAHYYIHDFHSIHLMQNRFNMCDLRIFSWTHTRNYAQLCLARTTRIGLEKYREIVQGFVLI